MGSLELLSQSDANIEELLPWQFLLTTTTRRPGDIEKMLSQVIARYQYF